ETARRTQSALPFRCSPVSHGRRPTRVRRVDGPGPSLLLLLVAGAVLFDHGEYFVFAHDEVFLTFELDLLARVLAEEDQVAGLDVEGDALAVVLRLAVAGCDNLAL